MTDVIEILLICHPGSVSMLSDRQEEKLVLVSFTWELQCLDCLSMVRRPLGKILGLIGQNEGKLALILLLISCDKPI